MLSAIKKLIPVEIKRRMKILLGIKSPQRVQASRPKQTGKRPKR